MKQKKKDKKNKKKKDFTFVIILVVIVIIYLLFTLYLNTYYFLPLPKTAGDCLSLNGPNKDYCISTLVITNSYLYGVQRNPNICDGFQESADKDICLGSLAPFVFDPQELCHRITNLESRDHCFCNVARNTQNKELNKELCQFIQNKDICIFPAGVGGPVCHS